MLVSALPRLVRNALVAHLLLDAFPLGLEIMFLLDAPGMSAFLQPSAA